MGKSKNILVIRFSAMGDVALTIPALLSVVEAHPEINLTFLTRPFYASFIPVHDRIKAIGIELTQYKGIVGLNTLVKEMLTTHQIDEVIDLHNVLRSKIMSSLFKLKGIKVTTFDKKRKRKRAILEGKSTEQLPHITEQYLHTFSLSGYPAPLLKGPWISPKEKAPLTEFLKQNEIISNQHQWIGIAPFAAHTPKMWGIQNINLLINNLKEKGYYVFLFGGGKKEIEVLQSIEDRKNKVFSVAGKIPFDQELALMKKVDVLICMDSSNMHLGTLVGTKVVSIWGATTPLIGFYPYGNEEFMVQVSEEDKAKLTLSSYGNKEASNGFDWRENISIDSILTKIS